MLLPTNPAPAPAPAPTLTPAPAPVPTPPPLSHAHHAPPPHIRGCHKKYQKAPIASLHKDESVLDFSSDGLSGYHKSRVKVVGWIPRERVERACKAFGEEREESQKGGNAKEEPPQEDDVLIYEHDLAPGFHIIPTLLPPPTQQALLHKLLFRDLSNPSHKTNLNLHYKLPYPAPTCSFFDMPRSTIIQPIDPQVHKPLSVERMLEKKLRWMTLGGQYDWTRKEYPEKAKGEEVAFPRDISNLLTGIFPETITPQAAITNFYSPGDTLAPHRDVSESSSAALLSVSIGCDAIFTICPDDGEVLVVRIHSGDVVVMGSASRWAWHSVPKVVEGSCPGWLQGWPGEGWMRGKRVNLNVRQMWG